MNSIKLNCINCNKEFEKYKGEYNSQIKAGRRNFFCCLSCSVSFQRKNEVAKKTEEYNLNPKLCKCCNIAIPYVDRHSKVFCNQSCAACFNNKIRIVKASSNKSNIITCDKVKSESKEKPIIKRLCLFCKTEFEIKRLSDKRKYCKSSCRTDEIHNNKLLEIEAGNYTFKRNKPYKEYLISKHGHKCQMCSFTEWGGKSILLILDHIDGNSDNFKLENLRVICSNCDTLTSTYKGRNKGKGRFARKQRYHEGKSF